MDRLSGGEFGRAGINPDMKLGETGQKSKSNPDPNAVNVRRA